MPAQDIVDNMHGLPLDRDFFNKIFVPDIPHQLLTLIAFQISSKY
jgi:hypothetical protein